MELSKIRPTPMRREICWRLLSDVYRLSPTRSIRKLFISLRSLSTRLESIVRMISFFSIFIIFSPKEKFRTDQSCLDYQSLSKILPNSTPNSSSQSLDQQWKIGSQSNTSPHLKTKTSSTKSSLEARDKSIALLSSN